MKGLSIHSKQRGFTLIEVGIALAIGLVIILGVARAIQASQERATVFELVSAVNTIAAAATEYKMSNNHTYEGIDKAKLKALGYDINASILAIKSENANVSFSLQLPAVGDKIHELVGAKVDSQFSRQTDTLTFKTD